MSQTYIDPDPSALEKRVAELEDRQRKDAVWIAKLQERIEKLEAAVRCLSWGKSDVPKVG